VAHAQKHGLGLPTHPAQTVVLRPSLTVLVTEGFLVACLLAVLVWVAGAGVQSVARAEKTELAAASPSPAFIPPTAEQKEAAAQRAEDRSIFLASVGATEIGYVETVGCKLTVSGSPSTVVEGSTLFCEKGIARVVSVTPGSANPLCMGGLTAVVQLDRELPLNGLGQAWVTSDPASPKVEEEIKAFVAWLNK